MIVTINNIQKNVTKQKTNGTGEYTTHIVNYTNADGKTMDKNVFPGSSIEAVLNTVAEGENVEIRTEKKGQFYNWVSMAKTDKKPEKFQPKFQASGGASRSTFDANGAKIGNISNCATAIFSAKLTKTLKEAVNLVFEAHTYIEAKLAGATPVAKSEAAPAAAPAQDKKKESADEWTIMEDDNGTF